MIRKTDMGKFALKFNQIKSESIENKFEIVHFLKNRIPKEELKRQIFLLLRYAKIYFESIATVISFYLQ
jgi:hypothetical protein